MSSPGGAHVRDIILSGASGERRVPLFETLNGMRACISSGLAAQEIDFSVDVPGTSLAAHLVDQSYALPEGEFLRHLRPPEATSSQEGDTTLVENTVTLDPAAGR